MKDKINPYYYKNGSIEVCDFIVDKNLNYCQGNIVKYALRKKDGENPDEKWNKIIHYCELAKQLQNKK